MDGPVTTSAPVLELPGGARVPQVGLGTWPMDDDEVEAAMLSALELGYRHVDTAENYGNEKGVGRAIAAAGIDRSEVFVTTKFNRKWHKAGLVGAALEQSLERLALDRVDLLLIHWPNPDQDRYVEAWEGMIELRSQGLVSAIGVSNFKVAHLQRLIDATGVAPEVNQIQLSPYLNRAEVRRYHAEHGIVTAAWSPLGSDNGLLAEGVVRRIAQTHSRTPGQIVLRWDVQQGMVTVPKSASPLRQAENLAIFDFSLTDEDIAALAALETGEENAADSDHFGH